jgi:hypothetical protein
MPRVTIMIAPMKGGMPQPAGRSSDFQVRTRAEEDECGVLAPGARAAELPTADPRVETAGQLVEAVGIEQPAVRPLQTILEGFRGQVSMRTRRKNTRETR